MSVGSRARKFRGRYGSWQLVHQHRVGGVTTASAWVGLGANFGNRSMEAMLSCGFPITLNKIWETASKRNTRGEVASQELSVKDRNKDKKNIHSGEFLSHKYPLCFIEGRSVFTRSRQTRRELGAKDPIQAYGQLEQVMEIMKNYATSTSALPLLTSIPEKYLRKSCGLMTRFTRLIHLRKRYLRTKELVHWEHL